MNARQIEEIGEVVEMRYIGNGSNSIMWEAWDHAKKEMIPFVRKAVVDVEIGQDPTVTLYIIQSNGLDCSSIQIVPNSELRPVVDGEAFLHYDGPPFQGEERFILCHKVTRKCFFSPEEMRYVVPANPMELCGCKPVEKPAEKTE